VTAYARTELGIALDRWQQKAINRALAVDAQGRNVHRLYLISTARQQGKTALVRALIGYALTGQSPPWGFILGLAHDRTQARIPYEAVMADLSPIAGRVGPYGRGGLAITRYLGIRSAMFGRHREYHVASREAANAIRGYTTDLSVFDEVRTQRDFTVWAALEPTVTQAAVKGHGLIVAISTAGDRRSAHLAPGVARHRGRADHIRHDRGVLAPAPARGVPLRASEPVEHGRG
jgi:phage terminase large subunit-like protein